MSKYPYRTQAAPREIDGVRFYSWHVAPGVYERRSEDGTAVIGYNGGASTTCWARVDDVTLGRLFRSPDTAARACARYIARRARSGNE